MVVALGAVALAGCARDASRGPRNIILISVDTLRPDRLGCYGCPEARSPWWDRLARNGTQFRAAFSSAPFTLPSHASLLSGVRPFDHRARTNGAGTFDPPGPTLAEALTADGLRCAAVTASVVLDSTTGLQRGFEHFEWQDHPGESERSAQDVTRAALLWLSGLARDDRYFLFLHLYDVHDPYDPPPPWDRIQEDKYEGEIAAADLALHRFFQALEERGLFDRTAVVALSDHGEAFGEHGEEGHGFLVYGTTLRVPLVLQGLLPPAGRGLRSDTARLIDVMKTVLVAFGGQVPGDLSGRALQSRESRRPFEAYAESFEAHLRFGAGDLRTLRLDDWKYVRAPRPELYDVATDPQESHNVIAQDPERAARMEGELEDLLGSDLRSPAGLADGEAVDDARARELAALGYVTAGEARPAADGKLPDPKDLVALPALLDELAQRERSADWDAALPITDRVLALAPSERAAWRVRAEERFARGSVEAGLAVYESAVGKNPQSADLWSDYGTQLLARDRADDARVALRKAVDLDGTRPETHVRLAIAALRTGYPRVAWKEVDRALELDPDDADAQHLQRELIAREVPRPDADR